MDKHFHVSGQLLESIEYLAQAHEAPEPVIMRRALALGLLAAYRAEMGPDVLKALKAEADVYKQLERNYATMQTLTWEVAPDPTGQLELE